MKKLFLSMLVFAIFAAPAFATQPEKAEKKYKSNPGEMMTISDAEVLEAQRIWGEGIVKIGKTYSKGGDYVAAAEKHINELYGYNMGEVLFKPTLASDIQFRTTYEGALSYFVGKNEKFAEDKGFAIRPWTNVRWESTGIKTAGNMAIAMGNYYFTPKGSEEEVKVEYVFGYTKDDSGDLRIVLHSSHIPYTP